MTYEFRDASPGEAKPLIGFYAESGGGKTYSSLLLACGFVGGDMRQVGMIETESGRGEAWAADPIVGGYRVVPLRQTFSPTVYGSAIAAAERANLKALIIDSASHEWEGVGGVLDMAAKNQADGKTGQLVWQKPKIDHAREFMLRLTQTPIPLVITCMRAKYPMEQVTAKTLDAWDRPGKPPKIGDWIRSGSLSPKQSDDILSEMFVHGWLDKEDHRFHLTKDTIPEMRAIFIDGEPISIETGKRLAAWSAGLLPAVGPAVVSTEQLAALRAKCAAAKVDESVICERGEVSKLEAFPADLYAQAARWLDRKASSDTGRVRSEGPAPITDEVDALRLIERSKDAGEASAILDLCAGQPFYDRAAKAVRAQFP